LIQVLVNVLQLTPGRWPGVGLRLAAVFSDPTILPRYLHFLLGSLAVAGLFFALLAVERHRTTPDPAYSWIATCGVRWALVATGLQVADGLWFLFALPEDVLRGLMQGRFPETPTLAIASGLGLLTLILLSRTTDPIRQRSLVHGATASMLVTLLSMIPLRDMVRDLYLAPFVRPQEFPVKTQADVLTIFLVLFAAGLATVGWMILRVVRERQRRRGAEGSGPVFSRQDRQVRQGIQTIDLPEYILPFFALLACLAREPKIFSAVPLLVS
jgi:hypothetical protein